MQIVVSKDEITWQAMLLNLVKEEHMDPWDIDITSLTQRYIGMLKKLKELDFRISGKMVLAAAILLRLKTKRLVGEDINELDRLMRPPEEDSSEGFYDELEQEQKTIPPEQYPELMPRTPQPRKRKVSIYDLMGALQQALEVRDRRTLRRIPLANMRMPERNVDITKLINSVYDRIKALFDSGKTPLFSGISAKEDRILTFVAMLHLANHDQRKIDLKQAEPFGEIEIVLTVSPN